jgi:hypothetical protein
MLFTPPLPVLVFVEERRKKRKKEKFILRRTQARSANKRRGKCTH